MKSSPCRSSGVGAKGAPDDTALGDMVNTAARLQGAAAAGVILITQRRLAAVEPRFPKAVKRELEP